jgi:hypothetical protein
VKKAWGRARTSGLYLYDGRQGMLRRILLPHELDMKRIELAAGKLKKDIGFIKEWAYS